jgi:hypothetical protein
LSSPVSHQPPHGNAGAPLFFIFCMLIKLVLKKRKQSFLMNPQVLTWAFCFLKSTEGYLIAGHQKIYLRSKIKTDTKNHEKSHFNLTTGYFCLQNTRQLKDFIEWRVLDLWPNKLDF